MSLSSLRRSLSLLIGASICFAAFVVHSQAPKGAGKEASAELTKLLQAIKEKGEPTSLSELNAWYPKPPEGQNAAPLYMEAFSALSGTNFNSAAGVAKNRRTLELLHKATSLKACRYDVDLSLGMDTRLSHLRNFKPCSQLLKQAAVDDAKAGRTDASAEECLDGLFLAESLAQEPCFISQLARDGCLPITISAIEQAISHRPFSESQVISMQYMLRTMINRESERVARCFAAERIQVMDIMQQPERVRTMLEAGRQTLETNGLSSVPEDTFGKLNMDRAAIGKNLQFYLETMNSIVEGAKQNLNAAMIQANRIEADPKPKDHILAKTFLAAMPAGIRRMLVCSAYIRCAEVGLATERYRMANHGSLPDSLEQLIPKQLRELPIDPFDGKPVRFTKLAKGGFVIYSVGPDLKDNEGTPKPPPEQSSKSGYDLTFMVTR